MKHSKKIFALMLSLLTVISLTSCKDSAGIDFDTEGLTTITYKINSGYILKADGIEKIEIKDASYGNSKQDVVYYYDLKGGKSCKALNISEFSTIKNFQRPSGYKLTGWYKDSNYTQLWDFEKDLIQDGTDVVLYPKWESIIKHHYEIKYKDGDVEKDIYSYEVQEGDIFGDYFSVVKDLANKQGITWLGSFYLDPDCTIKWDYSYKHPGGTKENNVPIYIDYIKGVYTLVGTYEELTDAIIKGAKNIYLTNDIDCGGKDLSFKNYYGSKTRGRASFIGNGHTISNFIMTVNAKKDSPNRYSNEYFDQEDVASNKNTLGVSLFGDSEYVDFSDVTFKDFKFEINSTLSEYKYCVISPFAYRLANSSLNNVVMENCEVSIKYLDLYDSSKKSKTFAYKQNYDELKACNFVKIVFDSFSYDLSGTTIENSFIRNINFKEN